MNLKRSIPVCYAFRKRDCWRQLGYKETLQEAYRRSSRMNRPTSFLFLREMRRLCLRNYQTNSASGKILNITRSLFIVSAGSVLAYSGGFGFRFSTPVGLAAGFDKDGEAVAGKGRRNWDLTSEIGIRNLPLAGDRIRNSGSWILSDFGIRILVAF